MKEEWENVSKLWGVHISMRHISSEEVQSGSPDALAWIAEAKTAREMEKAESFRSDPRCRPGALIEVQRQPGHTEVLLIGDINCEGGGCGCCSVIEDSDMVLRVRHLL